MSDWLHRMVDLGNPTTNQVLAFNGNNYEPTSVSVITNGYVRPGSIAGSTSIQIATTNSNGPSTANDIANADYVLDGTDDADSIATAIADTFTASSASFIIVNMSGFYDIFNSIDLPNHCYVIIQSTVPASGIPGEEHLTFSANLLHYTAGSFLFSATGTDSRLLISGAQITSDSPAGIYKLSNSYQLTLKHCNITRANQIHVTNSSVSAILVIEQTSISGIAGNAYPLLRAGYGSDGNSNAPSVLRIKDSNIIHSNGPVLKWDNCAYVDVSRNFFSGSGTAPVLYFRQDTTDTGASWPTRPPAYRQFVTENRVVSVFYPPTASPTAEPPFLKLSNIRGMIVTGNVCTFDCLYSSIYRTSNGNFVILDNYSAANSISNNLFLQASGTGWDTATPSTEGRYVGARIYLDGTTNSNYVHNAQQLITDNGSDNDIPVSAYVFNAAANFTIGESPRWPIRKTGHLFEAVGTLTSSASTTTTVDINVNGVAVGTLSFSAGTVDASTTFEASVAKNDALTIEIVAAGTGAGELVVSVRGY